MFAFVALLQILPLNSVINGSFCIAYGTPLELPILYYLNANRCYVPRHLQEEEIATIPPLASSIGTWPVGKLGAQLGMPWVRPLVLRSKVTMT